MNFLQKQALLANKIRNDKLSIQAISDYYKAYMHNFTAKDLLTPPFKVVTN